MQSAAAHCIELNIPLELHPLDCEPFLHRCGMNCSDAKIVFALWKLPIVDHSGIRFDLALYTIGGDGIPVIGNDVTYKSDLINTKEVLVIPSNAGNLVQHTLPIYNNGKDGMVCAILIVISSQKISFSGIFSSAESFYASFASLDTSKSNEEGYFKRAASQLHFFTHSSLLYMFLTCQQAKGLTPPSKQASEMAIQKCTSCIAVMRSKHSSTNYFALSTTTFKKVSSSLKKLDEIRFFPQGIRQLDTLKLRFFPRNT